MIINKHLLIIIFLGFLIYSNTLKNPYLWDDKYFVEKNNFIKSFKNSLVFFSPTKYFKYTYDQTYRPLPFLVHMANYKIWNINSVGHRITNIILHIANAVLIYLLVFYILKNNFVAFLSALLFVVHPVNTEVVNMVSFVETQLSTLFFMFSLFFYIKKTHISYLISPICFFLAVFCKETAVTLPAVLILYDLIFDKSQNRKSFSTICHSSFVIRYFFIIAVFYLVVRFLIFRHPTEAAIKYPGDSFITNIFVMLKAIPVYLSVVFLPFNLSVEYNIEIPATLFQAPVIFGFLSVIVFVAILIYTYKNSKNLFFWLMWIPITFLPTSNIIPMQNIVAERYLYLPLIGVCVLLAVLLDKIGRRQLIAVYGLAGCIIVLLATMTVVRNLDWKDDWTFYSKTLKQNPESPSANLSMGAIYAHKKDFKNAIELISFSLQLDPDNINAKWALASTFYKAGEYDKSAELFKEMAQENQFQYGKTPFIYLGLIYKIKKDYNKAIENFNKELVVNPLSVSAYFHLAEIYKAQGGNRNVEKAIEYYQKSIELNPNYEKAKK
ncbi:MAG: tetratricopeptide repeat protein [Elusimicrobiota bacterium]